MLPPKKQHPKEKSGLHPRNKHRKRYNFKQLIESCAELAQYVKLNDYMDESINFFNPDAVKTLNKALLKHFYGIDYWEIPKNYLCPPIPGRADYIHHAADLLRFVKTEKENIPTGNKIKCLDIGMGANCVYPIIGNKEYGWLFVGTDIDTVAIANANKIIEMNTSLKGQIECRLQPEPKSIFKNIIQKDECFDLTICNPPFNASLAEAQSGTVRKLQNLKHKKITKPILNFGGQNNELWCEGGEEKFVIDMITESMQFATSCFWFSTLVSKQSNLQTAYHALKIAQAIEIKTIEMSHGNKISRIVAWTFLTAEQQKEWVSKRWG